MGLTPTGTDDDGAPADTPADVGEVESQVEQVREREFLHDVFVQAVSADEIAAKLQGAFDETYPKEFYDRRSVAWQTIRVLPDSVTIREALLAYQTGRWWGSTTRSTASWSTEPTAISTSWNA